MVDAVEHELEKATETWQSCEHFHGNERLTAMLYEPVSSLNGSRTRARTVA